MKNKSRTISGIRLARDRQLARNILAGDEKALKSFMDEYFPRLYRYARQRLCNEADVEDVVQVCLIQAARRLETYRGEATLLTWLVQICRHEISKSLVRHETRADMMLDFFNDDLLRAAVEAVEMDPATDPEIQARRGELSCLIQLALDQLPENYAVALEMKYIEGCGSREIADRLHASDVATQSLLARARSAFREICGDSIRAYYGDEGLNT